MTRKLHGIRIVPLLIAIGLILPACAPTPTATEAPEAPAATEAPEAAPVTEEPAAAVAPEDIRIVVVNYLAGNPFFVPLEAGARDAAELYGIDFVYVAPERPDLQAQTAMIDAAVESRADGIVVVCGSGPDSMNPAIDRAVERGVIVATTNVDCPDSMRSFTVTADFEEEGRISADLLAASVEAGLVAEPVRIAAGLCVQGQYPLNTRRDFFWNTLDERGVVDWVNLGETNTGLEASTNLSAWESITMAHPDVNFLYGTCGMDARAAGQAAERSGNPDIRVAGYDMLPETLESIKSGRTLWTLGQNPYYQGYAPVELIVLHLLTGAPLPSGLVPAQTEIITAQVGVYTDAAAQHPTALLQEDIDYIIQREAQYYTH